MIQNKTKPNLRFPNFNEEWKVISIGDVVQKVSNQVKVINNEFYQEIGIRSHGKGIFHKELKQGTELGNKRVFWVEENALVVNIVFAWEQAVASTTIQEKGMIASHRFPMYIPRNKKCIVNYLLHFFLTPKGKVLLELASPGGAGRNKTLGQNEFLKLSFRIPTLPEQQKIASFFTAIDQKLTHLKRKKTLLEHYKKGVMQKIFSREIRFRDDEGGKYPDWEMKRLGEVGKTYNGITGKTKDDFGEGKPYVQYKQIFDDSKIDIARFGLVGISPKENQNRVLFGDVFFTVSSETPNEIGTASVLLDEVEELYLNSFCFGYRANSFDILNPYFSRYLFRSKLFRNEIVKLAQGSTRYNMSKIELLKIIVNLPSLPEQTKIANFLSAIDKKIEAVAEAIEATEKWKRGLMQRMFV